MPARKYKKQPNHVNGVDAHVNNNQLVNNLHMQELFNKMQPPYFLSFDLSDTLGLGF